MSIVPFTCTVKGVMLQGVEQMTKLTRTALVNYDDDDDNDKTDEDCCLGGRLEEFGDAI